MVKPKKAVTQIVTIKKPTKKSVQMVTNKSVQPISDTLKTD